MTNEQHQKAMEIKSEIEALRSDYRYIHRLLSDIKSIEERYPAIAVLLETFRADSLKVIEAKVQIFEEKFAKL